MTDAPDVSDSDLEQLRAWVMHKRAFFFGESTLWLMARTVYHLCLMARDIRQEIAVLRATPSAEVAQLRKELRCFQLRV